MADIMKQFILHLDGMAKFNVANAAAKAMAEHCDKRIAKKNTQLDRMRRALQKIADLPLRDHANNAGRTDPRLRARRIAVAALKATAAVVNDERCPGEEK